MKKLVLGFVLLSLLPLSTNAAITYDNSGASMAHSTVNSFVMTITSGASLWACVDTDGASPTSITWNGTNLTKVLTNTGFVNLTIWYLASPVSGSQTLQANFAGTQYSAFVATSLLGTATSPLGNTTSTSSPSTTSAIGSLTTSTANSWVINCGGINQNNGTNMMANGINQTIRQDQYVTTDNYHGVISTQTTTAVGTYLSGYTWDGTVQPEQLGLVEVLAGSTPSISTTPYYYAFWW